MKVHHPPGRAGRPWLTHRLDIAHRGVEPLDDKHRALLRERARLEPEAAEARERWRRLAREAEHWLTRAAVLGGERQIAITARAASAPATVNVRWQTVLGVTCPAGARVEQAPASEPPSGASAALIEARRAHRRPSRPRRRRLSPSGRLR